MNLIKTIETITFTELDIAGILNYKPISLLQIVNIMGWVVPGVVAITNDRSYPKIKLYNKRLIRAHDSNIVLVPSFLLDLARPPVTAFSC